MYICVYIHIGGNFIIRLPHMKESHGTCVWHEPFNIHCRSHKSAMTHPYTWHDSSTPVTNKTRKNRWIRNQVPQNLMTKGGGERTLSSVKKLPENFKQKNKLNGHASQCISHAHHTTCWQKKKKKKKKKKIMIIKELAEFQRSKSFRWICHRVLISRASQNLLTQKKKEFKQWFRWIC